MSTLRLTTISNQTGSSSVPSDTVINGSAKAWVNFNGTGTVAIRASFNVSSITDNNTGDYTLNFTAAMPDANFSVASAAINDGVSNAIAVPNVINANGFTLSTAQTTAITTAADVNKIYAATFR